mmetsp:Transcript_22312/g.36936  ORF Transcript_22312/g.36936 Transcript_22312/m.36936 type:complete len:197 (-) Transcript_22312:212-802(-)|eukprot:CAMPEP_0119018814 /NCGR_PEP_ID=MMETSP1176-20130426/20285_1 /TAXON_ID=265551 /ORGANISM="Synedropsis recta cf, Strain CCMP1620" /LENGTH=196 /DNA_ID=CAMNT_0006972893 /DNA_START=226 /DNA_END=816 /DNA_ORIENTATION=+
MDSVEGPPIDINNEWRVGEDEKPPSANSAGDSDDEVAMIAPDGATAGYQRKMKRVLANRNSARASYQRRKNLILDLQSMSSGLSEKNSVLVAENKRLRSELQELKQQMNLVLLSSSNNSFGMDYASSMAQQSNLVSQVAAQQSAATQQPINQTMGISNLPPFSAPAAPQAGDLQRALLANQIRLHRSLGLPPHHGM